MTDAAFEVRLKGATDASPKRFRSLLDAKRYARAQVQNRWAERAEIWTLGGPKEPDLVRVVRRESS
jgi:hypothetical protein